MATDFGVDTLDVALRRFQTKRKVFAVIGWIPINLSRSNKCITSFREQKVIVSLFISVLLLMY